ncbi:MAG: GSCFA domain-containing protein [Rhodospirillales bacterium]
MPTAKNATDRTDTTKPAAAGGPIGGPLSGPIDGMLTLQLDAMFTDRAFKDFLTAEIAAESATFSSPKELLNFISAKLAGVISSDPTALGFSPAEQFEAVGRYLRMVAENMEAYSANNKPNPDAVFWPDPTRGTGQSIFVVQPYLTPLNLIDKETPVGSAGSCFGEEIAFEFQKRGFNYVVTEREDTYGEGVFFAGYDPDTPYARFSANWGIMFNTPSFRQLAEKAFGRRELPKLLFEQDIGDGKVLYGDPFREGVFFGSEAAFDANHKKHIAAAREAFLKSEVFIITLGLNECWEFIPDGSVLSRSPRNADLMGLVRPKVLTAAENVENIQTFIDIIREHNPAMKLIISVSPIPFIATVRSKECHVVTANTHSKAVLRVAADELVRANKDVYYFPSYELVTTCMENPWADDHRHVSRETVGKVMGMFNAMFVKDGALLATVGD